MEVEIGGSRADQARQALHTILHRVEAAAQQVKEISAVMEQIDAT